MRQRFENSGTFLNEATRLLTLLVALHPAARLEPPVCVCSPYCPPLDILALTNTKFLTGSGCLVPPFLDQDIQDLPILINGPKQIMLLSVDPNKDFIDKPLIAAWTRSFA